MLVRIRTVACARGILMLACVYFVGGGVAAGATSLRFYGHGVSDIDRVKVPLDAPHRTVDVGGDFTLEWWMKALAGDNTTPSCVAGNDNWIFGNVLFDRDVYGGGDYGDYGVSLRGGRIAFGVHNGTTGEGICGSTNLSDGQWHHVAVVREAATGAMRIYVDGVLDGSGVGPTGDISYRDGRPTSYPNSDPYLVVGAEKHDAGPSYPSFNGWIDEVRLSPVARYAANFTRPSAPFAADSDTVLLLHFDEGAPNSPCTGAVTDSSPGGQNPGQCNYGGSAPAGPVFSADSPFGPPIRDVVVDALRPLSVKLPDNGQTVSKKVRVRVRNATSSGAATVTVQLSATTDCPAGVIASGPDFDAAAPGVQDMVSLAAGQRRQATMTLSFDPAMFSTPNSRAPVRCRVSIASAVVAPTGAVDPNAGNEAADLEVNVIDRNDSGPVTVHEAVVRSLRPQVVRIPRNSTSKTKNVSVSVLNADANEPAGDLLQLAVLSTTCPAGTIGTPDFDASTPGAQDTATVPGTKAKSARLTVTAIASDFASPNATSPARCVTRLQVIGPGTDPENTNNVSDLVLEVYDKNDF